MWLRINDKVEKNPTKCIFKKIYCSIVSITQGFDMKARNFMHEVLIKPLMLNINLGWLILTVVSP